MDDTRVDADDVVEKILQSQDFTPSLMDSSAEGTSTINGRRKNHYNIVKNFDFFFLFFFFFTADVFKYNSFPVITIPFAW